MFVLNTIEYDNDITHIIPRRAKIRLNRLSGAQLYGVHAACKDIDLLCDRSLHNSTKYINAINRTALRLGVGAADDMADAIRSMRCCMVR
jgi:hypothetical protein